MTIIDEGRQSIKKIMQMQKKERRVVIARLKRSGANYIKIGEIT